MVTDEEHVLTLGEEFSPNSLGYSSGYDLEIPEEFLFDPKEMKNRKTQTTTPKSAVLLESAQKKKVAAHDDRRSKSKKGRVKGQLSSKGTQTKKKARQETPHQAVMLTSIEPVERASRSVSPERKPAKQKRRPKRNESPQRRSPPGNVQSKQGDHKQGRRPRSRSPEKRSSHPQREEMKKRQSSPSRRTQEFVHPKQSNPQNQSLHGTPRSPSKKVPIGVPVYPAEAVKKSKNKRVQFPPRDNSYQRVIIPSKHWVPDPEPKKTHDVGVGTKPMKKQKSIAVQTPKPKEPTTPIYFLKPISSQEVFIDDTTQSEASMSRAPTSITSHGTSTAVSESSWTKSSSYSSAELTDPSEVENEQQPFTRNKVLYSSTRKHRAPTVSSMDSIDAESDVHAQTGPVTMVLGESESIHASSYSAREGKLFCITRSRDSLTPPETLSRQTKVRPAQVDERQIEPSIDTRILRKIQMDEDSAPPNERTMDDDILHFNPTDVGRWVLDCYINDHKLTTQEKVWLDENLAKLGPEERQLIAEHRRARQLEYASRGFTAEDYGSEFEEEEPEIFPPVPAAPAKLEPRNYEARPGYIGNLKGVDTGTEASLDIGSEVGVFQKELIKAKHKIWKRMQSGEKSPDPTENYKNKLKQWNDSPTSNVVLAECCEVTDADSFRKSPSPKRDILRNAKQKSLYLNANESHVNRDQRYTPPTGARVPIDHAPRAVDAYSKRETLPSTASLENAMGTSSSRSSVSNQPSQQSQAKVPEVARQGKSLQSIDDFLDELEQDRAQRNSLGKKSMRGPPPPPPHLEDWRVISPRPTKLLDETSPRADKDVDVNDNHTRMRNPGMKENHPLRRSMDSLVDTPSKRRNPNPARPNLASKGRAVTLASDPRDAVPSPPSTPIANPFKKMDQEEITSTIKNFQMPAPQQESHHDSEKELIDSLEQARERSKRESLEERTARILGIHRKVSSSSSEEDSHSRSRTPTSGGGTPLVKDEKKDLNLYMNNLLTGVKDVSPATKQQFLASGKNKPITSPLAQNNDPSKETFGTSSMNPVDRRKALSKKEENSDSEWSEDAESVADSQGTGTVTVTESFSVNVSDSVLEADVNCTVKQARSHGGDAPTVPDEYKIPENEESRENTQSESNSSPTGNMMKSYTRNIYANSPGFHKGQEGYDTDDTDLDPLGASMDSRGMPGFVEKRMTPQSRRLQGSPVPVSSNSAPLTQQEIDIVKELCDQNVSRSHSLDGAEDPGKKTSSLHSPEEYDIKILNAGSRKEPGMLQEGIEDETRRPSLQLVGKHPRIKSADDQWTNKISINGRATSPSSEAHSLSMVLRNLFDAKTLAILAVMAFLRSFGIIFLK